MLMGDEGYSRLAGQVMETTRVIAAGVRAVARRSPNRLLRSRGSDTGLPPVPEELLGCPTGVPN